MKKLTYSEYLYSNLLREYSIEFAEAEYDIQFEILPMVYNLFVESKFNIDTKSEYECMIDYLTDCYKTTLKDKLK